MLERNYGMNIFYASRLQAVVAALLVAQLSVGMAASPAIGVATAKGSFRLDASAVSGTGTLFDGSTVETETATSELSLRGTRMIFDSRTRGKIYRDHTVIERGTGQVEVGKGYRIQASNYSIEPSQNGVTKVTVRDNRVLVAALEGPVRIRNASGLLLANLATGRAVELAPSEDGASAPSKLTGMVSKQNGHYYLTDETLGITVELTGNDLEKQVGHRVEVTCVLDPNEKPVDGKQKVRVVGIVPLGAAGAAAAGAAGAGAGAAGAGAAGAGAATAGAAAGITATTAVVAGVVVAGAATGLAVGLTRDDPEDISK